jgi:hypothetical protein
MIVKGKKFDIRQWAVVTSWSPLKIFIYDQLYTRFSPEDYDPARLHDVYSHLTNNTIAKNSSEFDNSEIEGNMWDHETFSAYVNDKFKERMGTEDPFTDLVMP